MATHLHVDSDRRPGRQTDRGGYCLWQRRKSRDVSNLRNAPKRYNPSLVPLSLRSIRGRAPRPPMGGPHRMTRSGGVGFPPPSPVFGTAGRISLVCFYQPIHAAVRTFLLPALEPAAEPAEPIPAWCGLMRTSGGTGGAMLTHISTSSRTRGHASCC